MNAVIRYSLFVIISTLESPGLWSDVSIIVYKPDGKLHDLYIIFNLKLQKYRHLDIMSYVFVTTQNSLFLLKSYKYIIYLIFCS